MSSQIALYHYECGVAEVRECEIPEPTSSEVLVKVAAVALSPIDWKILHGSKPSVPTILGCDFAGTVTCVGDAVTKIKIGERVIGCVAGGNPLRPTDGVFAQYVAAPAHMILRLPNNMSFEDGASLPSSLFVGALSLYKCLSIPYPPLLGDKAIKEPRSNDKSKLKEVLIYGGGTATGSMQIQLAKL
ncbi:chaperonin 10-like protein [Trichoderma sp. SZMC 28011]